MTSMDLERADQPHALLPMSVTDARDTMTVYQDICRAVLTPSDVQAIGDREFVKRSGFQKLAVAYGLSTEILTLTVDRDPDGNPVRAHATVRAVHKTGRSADGDGACEITERRFQSRGGREKPEHDLRATATTRATNRAVSNLIAFGAMSAEEIEADAPAGDTDAGNVAASPWWAQLASSELTMEAADAIATILKMAGDVHPAIRVAALGKTIRSGCDGEIPVAVAMSLITLAEFVAPREEGPYVAADPPSSPATGTDTPDATNPTGD